MPHSYFPALALAALLAAAPLASQAQALNYTASAAISRAGTYTDLGTSGTAIATANTDDANSAAQAIGFTFNYNGTAFTQFILNTNGLIRLGTVAPAAADFITYGEENTGGPVNNTAETNLLMPFNMDLTSGSGRVTEYRMAVTGVAPYRVCTVQWKDVKDKMLPASATDATPVNPQFTSLSFQVKLYETSNNIEFVYGPSVAGRVAEDNYKYANVGLKGSGSATNQLVLAQKASVSSWSVTNFLGTTYGSGNTHNVRGTLPPDVGRTYSFGVPVANDAAVTAIQGYGAVLAPGGSPVTIRAVVRNTGTTTLSNLPVSLAVSGANTLPARSQTIATLSPGNITTVSFSGLSLPTVGQNTVTVTVPTDGNVANNTLTQDLITSATDISFIVPAEGLSNGYGVQPGNESGFAAKCTINTPRDVVAVRAFITDYAATSTAGSTVGQTVYGVVVNAVNGSILARSPNFVVTAAAANTVHTFPLSSPVTVPAGDFLVGMVQIAPTGSRIFYSMGVQREDPTRPGLFYSIDGASTPTPRTPTDVSTGGTLRYMLEAVTAPPATCPTPSNITATAASTSSATVSFTGPPNGTSYTLIYTPAGGSPLTTGTTVSGITSPFTLPGLVSGTCYDVYVRAQCGPGDQSNLAGPVSVCTPCTPPIITAFPYTQNFDVNSPGQDLPCGIAVSDDNADGFTWESGSQVQQGVNVLNVTRNASRYAMIYQTNTDGITNADDWFYLPATRFVMGSRYRLSFYYRNNSLSNSIPEALEVKYGPGQSAAAQTTLLYSNLAISTGPVTTSNPSFRLANNTSAPAVADITATTTGLSYIGFHAISDADRQFLVVEDVNIIGITATSAALAHAVNVYPNPSATGSFTLDISGANTQSPLQVEITNALGQRVFTGTARDNFRNELNLSDLAAGIYSLRVRNGNEYFQQQLAIVK